MLGPPVVREAATVRAATSVAHIHWLLTVQTVVIALLSINWLSSFAANYVGPNQFLRWVDLNHMLILPLVSMVAFYILFRQLKRATTPAVRR